MTHTIDEFFICLSPSYDGKVQMETANAISDIAYLTGKNRISAGSDKAGIATARTHCLEKLRISLEKNGIEHPGHARILWIDNDIVLGTPANQIADGIIYANEHNINLIADYKGIWEGGYIHTLMHPKGEAYQFYNDNEIRKLTPYEPLPEGTVGGLGFAYIDLPFDYRFEESHGFGEDIWLYRSLKMKLHYWKLRLGHKKEFVLWND